MAIILSYKEIPDFIQEKKLLPTDLFSDFNQALPCMLKDCGFQVPIEPQRRLFEEV